MKHRNAMLRVLGITALSVAVAAGLTAPAQAAPQPAEVASITVAGHTIDMAAVRAGAPYILSNGSKFALKPEAHAKLSGHDYAIVNKLVADANTWADASAAARTTAPSANAAELMSPCTDKLGWGYNSKRVALRLPACLVQNVGTIVAAVGTISALLATAMGATVAAVIAGSIGAGAAALVAANAFCNIFGPGNGVEVSVFYFLSPPRALPPTVTGCW